jgi:putative redox protein
MSETWKEVVVEWKGDTTFIGRNEAGGEVQMGSLDGRPGVGPMEMLLLGLAGCTGIDIVNILIKKREDVEAFSIKVRGLKADDYPKVWTDIEVLYELWGADLDPRAVEQAIHLSEEKYCSVGLMLQEKADIRSAYVIHSTARVKNLVQD